MKPQGLKKQSGIVALLVTIALPILLVVAGLALDFGHAFTNKTRLQNALDATALSAAIAINYDAGKSVSAAADKGRATFINFINAAGNEELKDLSEDDLVFDFSRSLEPWTGFDPASDSFAFVRVTSNDMLQVTPWLIRVLNQFNGDIAIPAIATAGPVGQNCTLAPFLLCADMPTDPSDLAPLDSDCNNDSNGDGNPDCYGYELDVIRNVEQFFCKNQKSCSEAQVEAGNFNLLNLPGAQGGNDINEILEGGTLNTCGSGLTTLDTKSGRTWGPVRDGVNYRIDHDGGSSADYSNLSAYQDYVSDGGSGFRVMAVPIGDCRGIQNGSTTLPKVGEGCIFLTKHAPNGSPFDISIQFIGSCPQNGIWDPNNPVLNGPYKIVLYKSPGSGDS